MPFCVCVCVCVIGGHRKEMLCNDWWLRVIYGVPGLQNASPRCIILYPSVMQIINSHHFMMNYFPDLHFNDNTSIHVACLLLRNPQTTHRYSDDSSDQNYIRSLCQRKRRRKGGKVPKLLLKVITDKRFRVKIETWLAISKSNLVACKSVTMRWKADDRVEMEWRGGQIEGRGQKHQTWLDLGACVFCFLCSFILQPTSVTTISI